MSRNAKLSVFLLVMFAAASTVAGGPSDLLQQAVEENETVAKGAGNDVDGLIQRADSLAERAQFNAAITLYEKAYRLAPHNQSNYIRLLVAKRSAGVMTEQDRQALTLLQEDQAAEVEKIFRVVRLNLIQARQAIRRGERSLAEAKAEFAGRMLDRLPEYVDDAPYRRELKSLMATAHRQTGKPAKGPKQEGVVTIDDSTVAVTTELGGRESEEVPTLMSAGLEDEEAAGPDVETGAILDVEAVLEEGRGRHEYDRELTAALRQNRAQVILSNNEAAFPPLADMTFPEDWAERTKRRSRYRDGVIHESEPFTGEDGKTYTTAIYDLGDLVHLVPNFYAAYPGTVRRQRIENLDRSALRRRSEIFGGYAEDLAAGMPLLHFFAGIDNNAMSTRTDPREADRVMRILEQFLQQR